MVRSLIQEQRITHRAGREIVPVTRNFRVRTGQPRFSSNSHFFESKRVFCRPLVFSTGVPNIAPVRESIAMPAGNFLRNVAHYIASVQTIKASRVHALANHWTDAEDDLYRCVS